MIPYFIKFKTKEGNKNLILKFKRFIQKLLEKDKNAKEKIKILLKLN